LAKYPPLLTAGTGLFGAEVWRYEAGRRRIGAFGCGKAGVGCRRPANPAKAGVSDTGAIAVWYL